LTDKKARKKKVFKDLRNIKKSLPTQSDFLSADKSKPASAPATKGNLSFEEEMRRLGVTPCSTEAGEEEDLPLAPDVLSNGADVGTDSVPPAADEVAEEDLFLSALKNFDKIFVEEEFSTFSESPIATGPRKFRRKRILPDKEIDLHGLTRREALAKVGFFLQNAAHEGLKTVLIITGRGRGSEGEAVLRRAMEDFLTGEGRRWVAGWERAPRKLGGEGAIAVFLKERSRHPE
jgi:DNA-nicking Smr family endonuclease